MTTNERAAEFVATRKPTRMHVAVNGCWSATLANGGNLSSYERLDYHAGTREFLQAVADAGVPFIYYGDVRL